MNHILVKKSPPSRRLIELFQTIDIKFSFVNKTEKGFSQCFCEVKCRDFLGDVIWSMKTGNAINIYGFNYDYKETPYDLDALRMSLTFPSTQHRENFINNIKYLHEKEQLANTKGTTIYETTDPLSLVIEADAIWQSNSWKLSLYTFYLKVASYENVTILDNPEDVYIRRLTPEIEKVFLSKIFDTKDFLYTSIDETHNQSGFMSIIKNYNKAMNDYLLGEQNDKVQNC